MRSSSAISLGVALVFGALAVLIARGVLADRPAGIAARSVVVATRPIGFGTPLTAENLRVVSWPADHVPDGAFDSVAEVNRDGRRLALAAIQRDEPILSSRISGPNQRATLSTQIEEGMRAVSIRVDEVRGVAGFVLPGDRVDVALTRGEGGVQEGAAYADILLQNAKVLAIDQLANDRQDKPAVARAVTLELSLVEAQRVILAQGVGRLSLILRQAGEPEGGPVQRVTVGDLGGLEAAARDRVAELERQLAETRQASEDATARAGLGVKQQMAEIEARLRGEIARSALRPAAAPAATPAPAAAPSAATVVNVTRNGAKREPYTVTTER